MTKPEFTEEQRAYIEELLCHVRQYLHTYVGHMLDGIAQSFGVSPDATRTDYTARYEQAQQVAQEQPQEVTPAAAPAPAYTPEQIALHAEVASMLRGAFAQGMTPDNVVALINMRGGWTFKLPQGQTLTQIVKDDEAGRIAGGEKNHSIVNPVKLKFLRDLLIDFGVKPAPATLLKEGKSRR